MVDFLARGASVAVDEKLRELETRRASLQAQIRDLENQSAAKPKPASTVDWSDNAALRQNIRATVRRIVMDNAAKWFRVDFLNGAAYTYQQDGEDFWIEKV